MTAPAGAAELHFLLSALARGERSVEDVGAALSPLLNSGVPTQQELRIDLDREQRCGYPEVVYAPGKSNEALLEAFERLNADGQACLATRCSPEQAAILCAAFPEAIHSASGRTVRISPERPLSGTVYVITAGTSDRPVGEEALETLRWMNVETELLMDLGVAGPQRFLAIKHRLSAADAIIVVAGMEGALPSVVGGWVSCPVFAVPTSVGYGAAFGGVAALLGMLNSCAANVAVVNIDAGFKAGYLAGLVAQRAAAGKRSGE
ncbi:nickel pincer cofactor biosynthesis protein LarB [Planctomicrobium sp. SH664]|uniref:nickel pincer cofactor biosynthesis protein LarB n=1 Tax=Planctomicrobium sp. SH664 TaxID=3448125 RepID=UPI003F5B607B